MNMGSGVAYTRKEGETTEWEDILRKKGITEPTQAELERAAAAAAEQLAEEASERIDPHAGRGLRDFDELEEEGGGYDDSRELESYRAKRVAEIKAAAARNKFGVLYGLSRADFTAEVNDASVNAWVVLFLHQEHVTDSCLLACLMPTFAAKHKGVKFMQIKADACIEGYPDRNVPTLLLYHEGSLQGQVVGLSELGGPRVNADCVEWVLNKKTGGAVVTEMLDDPRELLLRAASQRGSVYRSSRAQRDEEEEED
jgi:hypothetical protein